MASSSMDTRATAIADVHAMFREVARVLKPGGVYALMTLAEAHVAMDVLHFPHGADALGSAGRPWATDITILDHTTSPSSLCPALVLCSKPPAGEVGSPAAAASGGDDDRLVTVRTAAGTQSVPPRRAVLMIREAQWLFNVRTKAKRVEKGNTFTLDLGGNADGTGYDCVSRWLLLCNGCRRRGRCSPHLYVQLGVCC